MPVAPSISAQLRQLAQLIADLVHALGGIAFF
jgi:hypothetical protein